MTYNVCAGHHIGAALLKWEMLDWLMETQPGRAEWTFVMVVLGTVRVMTTGGLMRHVLYVANWVAKMVRIHTLTPESVFSTPYYSISNRGY